MNGDMNNLRKIIDGTNKILEILEKDTLKIKETTAFNYDDLLKTIRITAVKQN